MTPASPTWGRSPASSDRNNVDAFHKSVLADMRAVRTPSRRPIEGSVALRSAFDAGTLVGWEHYQTCLQRAGVTRDRLMALRERHQRIELATRATARGTTAVGRPAQPAGSLPLTAAMTENPYIRELTPYSALTVDTVEEFMAMLRLVLANSNLNKYQLASLTGLPKSSVYNMFSGRNHSLPTKWEYVVTVVRACGLGPYSVQLVLDSWVALNAKRSLSRGAARSARSHLAAAEKKPLDVVDASASRDGLGAGVRESRPAVPTTVPEQSEDRPVWLTIRPGVDDRFTKRAKRAKKVHLREQGRKAVTRLTAALAIAAALKLQSDFSDRVIARSPVEQAEHRFT